MTGLVLCVKFYFTRNKHACIYSNIYSHNQKQYEYFPFVIYDILWNCPKFSKGCFICVNALPQNTLWIFCTIILIMVNRIQSLILIIFIHELNVHASTLQKVLFELLKQSCALGSSTNLIWRFSMIFTCTAPSFNWQSQKKEICCNI